MVMNGVPLGKGLGALLPPDELLNEKKPENLENMEQKEYFFCPISQIQPNPYQPRQEIDEKGLAELAESIGAKGVLQPLIVRRREAGDYELIAGERRLRASSLSGLDHVPVIVRNASPEERLELALIENIQRHDLNGIEEAAAYKQLADEFSLTQEEIAKKVGKKRSTVSNALRLLQLPEYAKKDISRGDLSVGHGRALLSLDDPQIMEEIRNTIIFQGLSVRQTEQLIKKINKNKTIRKKAAPERKPISSTYCQTLTKEFVSYLGSKSRIIQNGERGKIEIEYYSLDDLERLHTLIVKNGAKQ